MNNRYWFVLLEIYNGPNKSMLNIGFISDEINIFSRKNIKQSIMESKNIQFPNQIMIVSFYEFKNQEDYNNFWED